MLLKQYRLVISTGLQDEYQEGFVSMSNVGKELNGAQIRNAFVNTRDTNTNYYTFLMLGDATTASENDNSVGSIIYLTHISSARASGSTSYIYNITETFQNAGTDEVTVNCVGLTICIDGMNYLLGKLVLDTPVTIAAGEIYSFTYTIS
jgi:hypothetical protein